MCDTVSFLFQFSDRYAIIAINNTKTSTTVKLEGSIAPIRIAYESRSTEDIPNSFDLR